MEFIIIGVLVLLWATGLLTTIRKLVNGLGGSLEVVGSMAEREIRYKEMQQKSKVVTKVAALDVSMDVLEQAKEKQAALKSFDI